MSRTFQVLNLLIELVTTFTLFEESFLINNFCYVLFYLWFYIMDGRELCNQLSRESLDRLLGWEIGNKVHLQHN